MTDTSPDTARLAAAFLAGSAGGLAPPDLGDRLLALVLGARAAHPSFPLDDERFVRHLAGHRPEGGTLDAWLASLCAEDLYLAFACAEGVPAAIEALDRQYRSQVGAFLASLRPSPDLVDDVAQAVCERVLVGAPGIPPRIAEYSGRGTLASWLRVVTLRLALGLRRKRTEVLPGEDNGEAAPPLEDAAPVDPEADLLKRRHGEAFNAAFRAAMNALPTQQRDLLRLHFVDGATLAELAAKLGIGRATVARRIADARREILSFARRELGEKLSLPPAELESLMGLMRSRLDLSLSSAFPREP